MSIFISSNMDTQLNSNSLKDIKDSTSAENVVDANRNMGLDAFEPIDLDYRSVNDDSSSTLSDSDSSNSSLSENEDLAKKKVSDVKTNNCRTKGELTLDDLPKVEELNISVQESELKAIGKITGIVDSEVIVSSFKNSIPLNIDSILFLSNGKPIGRIFDVFGPVIEPLYSVRFNSAVEIQEKEFAINDIVYYAPENNETTLYVFVDSLRKEKGSDASWTHNNEPPPECLDFSDDEQEKQARLKARAKNRSCDKEVTSEVQNKKSANYARSNEPPQCNVFSRSFNQNKFSPHQFENLSKFRFKCTSKNVSSNFVNKFTVPSYNTKPYQNRVGSYSEQFYQSSLQVPLGSNVNEKHSPPGIQQQFSPQVGINPRRNFPDTQSMSSSEMFVKNSNVTSGFQQLANNIPQPLTSGIRMESQRMPSKTSSEVLNETFFRFRNLPPPPPLPPMEMSSFQSSHLNVQSNVGSEIPASSKIENSEESHMSRLHFQANNVSSKSFISSSATSSLWQNHNQNSQTHSVFSLPKQGIESTIQNKNTSLFHANAEAAKIQALPKEFSGSSQIPQHYNLSSSMSTPSVSPSTFTQRPMNPSVFLRSPPPYFVSPYQNLNFCMTPPPHIDTRNSNGLQFRFPPNTPPPVNVIPPFSPGPWPPFHAPLFGILPTVNNPRTLQASSTNVTPALNQRPINMQVMQGSNPSPSSFTPNRFPFHDQRQPSPRGFPPS